MYSPVRAYRRSASIVGGLLGCLLLTVLWLLGACISILASALLIDALDHLGHYLLGW